MSKKPHVNVFIQYKPFKKKISAKKKKKADPMRLLHAPRHTRRKFSRSSEVRRLHSVGWKEKKNNHTRSLANHQSLDSTVKSAWLKALVQVFEYRSLHFPPTIITASSGKNAQARRHFMTGKWKKTVLKKKIRIYLGDVSNSLPILELYSKEKQPFDA